MGKLLVKTKQQREKRGQIKATNAELLKIAAGINHIIIKHDSQWSLMPGMGTTDKVFDVSFSIPPLKRPLTENDKMVAVEWAKYHPRYWRVMMTLDLHDGAKWYADHQQVETSQPYKLNELSDYINDQWRILENKNNHHHIRGRRWTATIIKTHERKAQLDADQ